MLITSNARIRQIFPNQATAFSDDFIFFFLPLWASAANPN
jgi:hypothetical protein